MVPAVHIVKTDGGLGNAAGTSGSGLVVIGTASDGPINAPAGFGRVQELTAQFGSGPGVEAAAIAVQLLGRVVFVRAQTATAGAVVGDVDDTGVSGTSTVTAAEDAEPHDDANVLVKILRGGTIGQPGITYQSSGDAGRTWSVARALTGTAITVEGVELAFGAGSLATGDVISFATTGPAPSAATVGTALDALSLSAIKYDMISVAADLDPAAVAIIHLKLSALAERGRYKTFITSARKPNAGETESAYAVALSTAWASVATDFGAITAGSCELTSAVTGRRDVRSVVFTAAAREASLPIHADSADINLLGLEPSVTLTDATGNPLHHDESIYPGLDDSRFYVLRSHDGYSGTYVNNPNLMGPVGGDFTFIAHRRVWNAAAEVLRDYFVRRLSRPVEVSAKTGYITEPTALEIEAGARAALKAKLLVAPSVSALDFVLGRSDNLLVVGTPLTGDGYIIPLAYPKKVNLRLGFVNPALKTVRV